MRRISLSLYSLTSVLFGWQVSLMLWKDLATVIVNGIFGTNYGAYIAGKTTYVPTDMDFEKWYKYGILDIHPSCLSGHGLCFSWVGLRHSQGWLQSALIGQFFDRA